jgi:type II secretory pathway component GspD/PulD (secretin)
MQLLGLAAILAAFAIPLVAEAQPTPPTAPCESVEAVTIKVVPLTYARAGELAYTLSLVALPRVRIVPYYSTNSLIISGPRTSVEQLLNIIKPSNRD